MRTTVQIEDGLVEHARRLSGTERITDLLRQGLEALIQREARKRLVAFGGTDTTSWAPERQRGYAAAENTPPYTAGTSSSDL
jgi:hypothetical protein